MEVKITDLKDTKISGVNAVFADSYHTVKEDYLEWTSFGLASTFSSSTVSAGLLQGWHHTPTFKVVENHEDHEIFCFLEGTALMLFIDIEKECPIMDTAQIVRIPAGVTLEIKKDKGHFVAVAEDTTYKAIVVSPLQDTPKIALPEIISGI